MKRTINRISSAGVIIFTLLFFFVALSHVHGTLQEAGWIGYILIPALVFGVAAVITEGP